MSTSGSLHDRYEPSIPNSETPVSDQVAQLKQNHSVLYGRVLRYLKEKFSLTEEDIQGEYNLMSLLLSSADSLHEADRLVAENVELFRKSVENALRNIGIHSVDESDLAEMTEVVRRNIGTSFTGVETFLEGFYPAQQMNEFTERVIPLLHEEALEVMDERFGQITDGWEVSEHALTDTQLGERFVARVNAHPKYLSTYFDSACMGLVDVHLQSQVDQRAQQGAQSDWDAFLSRMRSRIVMPLEQVQLGDERWFNANNCFFQPNGTEAFRRFREAFMRPGQRVLVTSEEYFELIEDMKRHHVETVPFASLEEFEQLLRQSSFDFILASEVSRTGTVHPLRSLHAIRKASSPQTRLIVDACQSAGRWKHDLGACEADAVILSTQKGSDLGTGMGVVALAHYFRSASLSDQLGTLPHEGIARTAFSLNPDGLSTLTPVQRSEAISQNTKKFLELISAVNTQVEGRIRILSPSDLSAKTMGHALELSIEGISRKQVCQLAQSYGVYIADSYVSPNHPESIRVAFHPYMNNTALKILAYVLLKACDPNPYV